MEITTLIVFLANFILTWARPEIGPVFDARVYENLGYHNNSLERAHYNPWACNYRLEPGYKCLSCKKALHCYVNNFALLVQCGGLFPYCRSGFCSRHKINGCIDDETTKVTTQMAQIAVHHDHVTEIHDLPPAASVTESNDVHEAPIADNLLEAASITEAHDLPGAASVIEDSNSEAAEGAMFSTEDGLSNVAT